MHIVGMAIATVILIIMIVIVILDVNQMDTQIPITVDIVVIIVPLIKNVYQDLVNAYLVITIAMEIRYVSRILVLIPLIVEDAIMLVLKDIFVTTEIANVPMGPLLVVENASISTPMLTTVVDVLQYVHHSREILFAAVESVVFLHAHQVLKIVITIQ